jgi:hypothetical protein
MIEKILDPLLAPFREAYSKFMGIKNVADNAAGDVGRVKAMAKRGQKMADDAKKKGKELQDQAKAAQEKAAAMQQQAQGAYGQAQGAMGQAQGMMGGGKPGAPGLPPGMPQPGMPPGMPQPGMPPGMPQPGMAPGMAPGMGPPGMAPQMGGAMGRTQMSGPMGAPMGQQGPGVRTMALMAGGGLAAIGWLVPLKGPHRGQLFTLKPQSVIGKDPSCDVVLNDAFMSGKHATIRAQNGLFVLEDHSTNGTFVNDRKVQRHELVDSDFIKLGQTIMKFKAL